MPWFRDRYIPAISSRNCPLSSSNEIGRSPSYRGPLTDVVYQLVGGLRSGMGYCGAQDIEQLRTKARFCRVSLAGVAEAHPHDMAQTKPSPNYPQVSD